MNFKCENCKTCVFYREDADDVGTCQITDNIVDAKDIPNFKEVLNKHQL